MAIRQKVLSPKFLSACLASSVMCSAVSAGDGFIRQPKLKPIADKAMEPVAETDGSPVIVQPVPSDRHEVTPLQPPTTLPETASPAVQGPRALRWKARGSTNTPTATSPPSEPKRAPEVPTLGTQTPFRASIPTVTSESPSPNSARSSTSPKTDRESGVASGRTTLASLVSNQTLMEGTVRPDAPAVPMIDAPPGWQSVGERLSRHIASCESLLRRNASFSARAEGEAAILYLVRVLDLHDNRYYCEPAWLAAQQALREAEDFSIEQRLNSDRALLRRIVDSHETPVLKDTDVTNLAPMTAVQHYHVYAEQRLLEAAQYHPWASEVLYAIGRTFQAQADAGGQHAQMLRSKATTYYRAAHAISPENALAANQLGFILLQLDRPSDARHVLFASIKAGPTRSNLQNLVEASRRLGDPNTMQWALQQLAALQANQPPASLVPQVTEVDPRTFAAMSPYASGPGSQSTGTRIAARPTPQNKE